MINISQAIREIIDTDEEVLIALERDILNISSYARQIKDQVEDLAKKPVKTKSIIVALSRYKNKLSASKSFQEPIQILNLSIHSNLEGLTYERTEKNVKKVRDFFQKLPKSQSAYSTFTQGISEITTIGDEITISSLKKAFKNAKPLYQKDNLTGITVKFPKVLINTPNVLFRLSKRLAVKINNIIEIVSTFTEITFIVDKDDSEIAVKQLSKNI